MWPHGAYCPLTRRVFLHGGLLSQSEATQAPSAALHEYDIEERVWRPLPSANAPRYLHTATFVTPGVMLVFGGNAHNDSAAAAVSNPAGSKCYSGGAMLYDVRCQKWHDIPSPKGSARAAAAAVALPAVAPHSVLIHGGFDGRLRSDGLLYSAGRACDTITSSAACLHNARLGARACVWRDHACVPIEDVGYRSSFDRNVRACIEEPILDEHRCLSGDSCAACAAAGCAWCGACMSSAAYCPRHRHQMALSIEECGASSESAREACGRFHSCHACHKHTAATHSTDEVGPRLCYWDYETIKCRPANITEDVRSVSSSGACSAPCATYQACSNCTAEECIWCASAARCVDKNAYGASFPLGGCRAWSSSGGASTCAMWRPCAAHASCASCRSEPACGWCDDGGRGGRGACLPGGAAEPHAPHVCPAHRWHFTRCPLCQCNGHSVCAEGGGRCVQPCGGRAVGARCETCAPGHWGDPLNGGRCEREYLVGGRGAGGGGALRDLRPRPLGRPAERGALRA
ncbi:unnamed protein product [Plutella xylostella]|uniref:(diamondback moth) hypothetical protein n=1 Tax=Plutella xylostella TaxID=51655 RepID=A0A8S4ER73_PLUXY|nr:unnamed protein product [Plutella xylostella]